MKKNYIALSALVLSAGMFSFQKNGDENISKLTNKHRLSPLGIDGEYAGAPTDGTCFTCHGGTIQTSSSMNTLTVLSGTTPVTSYTPGETYTVALTMNPNPAKKGFQAVAMNAAGVLSGSSVAVTNGGAQVFSSGRVSHTITSNTSSNLAWTWSWTAPSADDGDITFYIASKSEISGVDVIYLSQHGLGSLASVEALKSDKYDFNAGYSSLNNSVVMDFNSLVAGEMYFNLVDLNG